MANDVFQGIGRSIAGAARKAADGTGAMIENSKIRARITSENKEISRLYEQLGAALFRRSEAGVEAMSEDETAMIGEVREHLAVIEELKTELAALKGKKICVSCGELIDMDAAFCPKCGAEMPAAEPAGSEPEVPDGVIRRIHPDAAAESPAGTAEESDDILDAEFLQVADEPVRVCEVPAGEAEDAAEAAAADTGNAEEKAADEVTAETAEADAEPEAAGQEERGDAAEETEPEEAAPEEEEEGNSVE